jgi:transcription elongation factor Elf1
MASATRTRISFEVRCPRCNDEDCSVNLNLNDLTGDVQCGACDAEYTVAEAIDEMTEKLGRWERVREWIEAAKPILDPCGSRYGVPAPRHQQQQPTT